MRNFDVLSYDGIEPLSLRILIGAHYQMLRALNGGHVGTSGGAHSFVSGWFTSCPFLPPPSKVGEQS